MSSNIWKRLVAEFTGILLLGATAVLADLNTGLVAYYRFDGNANDASGNGNNGTVYGASLTTDRLGNANSAYAFNGTSDFIRVADSATLRSPTTALTLALWANAYAFYPPDVPDIGWVVFLAKSDSSSVGRQYGLNYDRTPSLVFDYMGGPQYAPLQPPPGFDEWHHYAVTWDGYQVQFYLDGNSIGSAPLAGVLQTNTEPLMIGCDPPGEIEYFNGKLDDIRIYNRTLSEVEIQQLVDTDEDGVPDASDQCPNTPAGEVVNAAGCSISQLVPASWPWKNHGEYVSAVTHVAGEFMAQGLITEAQKGEIVSAAARSDVGKRR
jgi:hypothetical protein